MKRFFGGLVLATVIAVGALTISPKAAKAVEQTKKANSMPCYDIHGNIYSYGASCDNGSSSCTANACP